MTYTESVSTTLAIAGHFPDLEAQQNEPKPNYAITIVYCQERRRGGGHCNRACPQGLARCIYHELNSK